MNHQKAVICALLALAGILLAIFYQYDHVYDFFNYYNTPISTISNIAVIVSVCFVAYQVRLAVNDYAQRKKHSEFDTAYKLAGFYAKDIIPKLAYTNRFFSNINKALAPDYYHKAIEFKDFTKEEAERIFGAGITERFRKEFANPRNVFVNMDLFEFLSSSRFYALTEDDRKFIIGMNDRLLDPKKSEKAPTKIKAFQDKIVFIVGKDITNLMNSIEYFSMYFCEGLAAPIAVYRSLHQTYLDIVISAYLFIAAFNTSEGHEFYPHTTELYRKWAEQSLKTAQEKSTRNTPSA